MLNVVDADVVPSPQVFLSDAAFRYLEDFLRADDPEELAHNREIVGRTSTATALDDPYSPYPHPDTPGLGTYNDDFAKTTSTAALPILEHKYSGVGGQTFDDDEYEMDRKEYLAGEDDYMSQSARQLHDEERSLAPSGYTSSRPMFDPRNMSEKELLTGKKGFGGEGEETVEVIRMSSARKRWLTLTWLFTWWIPSPLLRWIGGMKRRDVRMAWREKVLIKCVAVCVRQRLPGLTFSPLQHAHLVPLWLRRLRHCRPRPCHCTCFHPRLRSTATDALAAPSVPDRARLQHARAQ